MIGAGIFVLPGPASGQAGPAVALAFVIGGVIALLTAVSASELGTAMPKAGGSYYYINHAMGPIFGTIAGWGNWMGLAFASAFYCLGFGDYVNTWLALEAVSLGVAVLSPEQLCGLSAAIVFIGINYIGAKETGRLQSVIVLTLLAILAVFTLGGIPSIEVSNLQPFAPRGYGSIFEVTALVFVSFLGFAKITTVAEEIKNPGQNLPIAIIGSVVIVTFIYGVMMILMNGIIPWDQMGEMDEIAIVAIADLLFGTVGVVALTFGGLLATASSANASILASSRINFAMGRDKLVSTALNEIHDRFATPHRAIALTGFLIVIFIVIGDVKTLAKAGSVLHLIVYGLLNISLVVMREYGGPEYRPDFKTPLYPAIPLMGAVLSFGLIAFMAPMEIALSAIFVLLSIGWYFAYAAGKDTKSGILFEPSTSPQKVAETQAVEPEEPSRFKVFVPLANPEHQKNLITLASAIARQKGGEVMAVHIVEVPDQTPLVVGAANIDELDAEAKTILDNAKHDAETFGVDIKTETIVAHEIFDQIFDATRNHGADLAILGWGDDPHGSPGRVESALGELTENLPCDFLVFKDRGFDPSRILLPTAGGPDSDVSAEIAKLLSDAYDSEISLLHVVDDEADISNGETFLADWAEKHGLGFATPLVEFDTSIESAVIEQSKDHTLLILGATEQGLLTRLTRGTSTLQIIDGVETSVLLVEKARDRTLLERLFGR